jgi:dTDP-4-dehydrorhamnose reductase
VKLLVTGAAGQLGAVMLRRFSAAGHVVVGRTRRELDVTRHDAVMAGVGRERPDVVVNCAAYNAVDRAEDEPLAALDTNAFAVRSLARAAEAAGAALVHFGTDFVFDGTSDRPYTEDDPTNPQSVYASSKLLGEWFVRDQSRGYVLRVESLFGGPAARSSIDRILDALEAGREARAFVDRVVSPSYVEDVAWATEELLERRAPPGLYHCVNGSHATWYELALEAAAIAGCDRRLVVPVRVADVQLRARRPAYAALSNARLASRGIVMPTWQDALRRYVEERRRARARP